jgi:hypothetical protein
MQGKLDLRQGCCYNDQRIRNGGFVRGQKNYVWHEKLFALLISCAKRVLSTFFYRLHRIKVYRMMIRKLMLAVGLVVGLSFGASAAQAAPVFSDLDFGPTPLANGAAGAFSTGGPGGGPIFSSISGSLAPDSFITIDYSFGGNILFGAMGSFGSYSYLDGGQLFSGTAGSIGGLGVSPMSFASGSIDGSPSPALAFASAQITSPNSATAVIQNLSAGVLEFSSIFAGLVSASSNFTATYSVSEVPVPAALPMFGLALAGLAGLRAKKKRSAAAV